MAASIACMIVQSHSSRYSRRALALAAGIATLLALLMQAGPALAAVGA